MKSHILEYVEDITTGPDEDLAVYVRSITLEDGTVVDLTADNVRTAWRRILGEFKSPANNFTCEEDCFDAPKKSPKKSPKKGFGFGRML